MTVQPELFLLATPETEAQLVPAKTSHVSKATELAFLAVLMT